MEDFRTPACGSPVDPAAEVMIRHLLDQPCCQKTASRRWGARALRSLHNGWSRCTSQQRVTLSGGQSEEGQSMAPQGWTPSLGCGRPASCDCGPDHTTRVLINTCAKIFYITLGLNICLPACYRSGNTVWDDLEWCPHLHNTGNTPTQPQSDRCCTVSGLQESQN